MDRRSLIKGLVLGVAATVPLRSRRVEAQTMQGTSASEFTLYRSSQTALSGTIGGATWAFPGTALTANTSKFYGSFLGGTSVLFARWVVVWNPNTGSSPTGIRLVKFDDGPTNIQQIARFDRTNSSSPLVDAVDVTTSIDYLVTNAQIKSLGHQTYGNGGNGCLIYGSWIEVVYG